MIGEIIINFKSSWHQFAQHLFSAKGCTSRSAYNYVMIPAVALFVLLTALAFACMLMMPINMIIPGVILLGIDVLYVILIDIFGFCLVARRNHDIGLSKWFALIMFIPHVHFLYLMGLMIVPTNPKYLNK